jgi:heme O synthase-like polyprenyltransferase
MEDSVAVHPSKFKTYLIFIKFRLSFLVILSAISGYLFAGGVNLTELSFLII